MICACADFSFEVGLCGLGVRDSALYASYLCILAVMVIIAVSCW